MPPKKENNQENIIDELSNFDSSEELPPPKTPTGPTKENNNQLIDDAPSPEEETNNNFSTTDYSNNFNQTQPVQETSTEEFQQIAESIVEEKFAEFQSKFGNILSWKDKVNNDLDSIKQEVLRGQDKFTELQKALFGKVNEYNENISSINTEMKALEKVFEKILEPLTTNIRELKEVTEKIKGKVKS